MTGRSALTCRSDLTGTPAEAYREGVEGGDSTMFGIPIAFLGGYFVARYFGDFVKETAGRLWAEIHEWL